MGSSKVTESGKKPYNLNYSTVYKPKKVYNNIIKRTVDFIGALLITVVLIPFFLIISLFIKINSPGSIFYRGVRTGRYGKSFRIFKFRSMINNADKIGGGTTALNDPRITKTGVFLRKSKMDEIPQLFNIIKGDMSFIGPRPELLQYTQQYENIEKIILDVRPGITDLSSLEFISLDEIVGSENADGAYEKYVLGRKNNLRVEYVLKQSLILDLKLFFKTIFDVLNKVIKVTIRRRPEKQYGVQKTEKF